MEWPGFANSPQEIGALLMAAGTAVGAGRWFKLGGLGRSWRGVLTSIAKIPMYSYQEAKANRATELLAWQDQEIERLEAEGRRKDDEIARLRTENAALLLASSAGSSAAPTSMSIPMPGRTTTP